MTDHTLTVTLNLDTEQLAAELRETLRETLRRHIATALMADRYAANEAKQREEAEPEWPEGFDGLRESHDWGLLTRAEKQVVIERWITSQRLNAAEREAKAEKARADFAAAVAADRYAANEARQREKAQPKIGSADWAQQFNDMLNEEEPCKLCAAEARQREAEPDPLDPSMAECSRCGELYAGTAEATMEHHRACTGETPENPMADPLDEDDHRDRMDADGLRVTRKPSGYWAWAGAVEVDGWTLDDIHRHQGPLAFAPDTTPQATGGDLSASEGESGAVEGGEANDAQKAILCPECGDHINTHNVEGCRFILCDCPRTPEDVARALIAEAVKPEWEADTDG